MIHAHLYARLSQTRVFAFPTEKSKPVVTLAAGEWMGVLEQQGDWIQVISVHTKGWIRADDAESKSPFNLHAIWSQGSTIEYKSISA